MQRREPLGGYLGYWQTCCLIFAFGAFDKGKTAGGIFWIVNFFTATFMDDICLWLDRRKGKSAVPEDESEC